MLAASDVLRTTARLLPQRLMGRQVRPVTVGFHGVVRRIQDSRIEVNHHEIDAFAAIVRTLKKHFEVLPLAAMEEVLKSPARHRRALFLTADDGYLNTSALAADVLDDARLPWTLFVSTHHVETGEPNPLFLARLFLYFAPAGRYTLPHIPFPVELGARRQEMAVRTIRFTKGLEAAKAGEAIDAMANAFPHGVLSEHVARFHSERFLSWSDVASLAARGVEIGAHAHRHWPMNSAQEREGIFCQARLSREAVIRHIGACRAFAYPFGNTNDVSPVARQAVREAGFSNAFTTISASLDGSLDPLLLPRYMLKPAEPNLPALLTMLPLGNARLVRWQRGLAAETAPRR